MSEGVLHFMVVKQRNYVIVHLIQVLPVDCQDLLNAFLVNDVDCLVVDPLEPVHYLFGVLVS